MGMTDSVTELAPIMVAPGLGIDDDVREAVGASDSEKTDAIRKWFGADCSRMTIMASRKFNVPEAEILSALVDQWPIVELRAADFKDIMEALKPVGLVRIFVKSRAAIIEVDGHLNEAKFSTTGPFFNVDGGGIDMHIFHGEIGQAFAVEKRSHMDKDDRTYSVQFYDRQGDAAFKVFLWADFPNTPAPALETYNGIIERFRIVI